MEKYAWPVAFLLSVVGIVSALAGGADMNVASCEKLCSPRGVHVYQGMMGRCECEAFVSK